MVMEHDKDVLKMSNYMNKDCEVDIYMDIVVPLQSVPTPTKSNPQPTAPPIDLDDYDNSSDYESMYDPEYDDENDDELFDIFIDSDAEFSGVETQTEPISRDNTEAGVDGSDNERGDSEELHSLNGSDSDDALPKFQEFNSKTGMANPELKLGMIFSDHIQLKEAVREYNIKLGKEVKFPKNEAIRVKVV